MPIIWLKFWKMFLTPMKNPLDFSLALLFREIRGEFFTVWYCSLIQRLSEALALICVLCAKRGV
jgi:hypothetical protein